MLRTIVASAALSIAIGWPVAGHAMDSIKTRSQTYRGQITSVSPTEVKIDTKPLEQAVKVNEIVSLRYDEEPEGLGKARNLAKSGQYEEALKVLEGIDRASATRKEVGQDIDYLIAYCTTQQALTGGATINAAGNLMLAFIKNNSDSYHFLEANELVGDLYIMAGAFDRAADFYIAAAKAPWPEAGVRINIKRGRALLAQKKTTEAVTLFQAVIDSPGSGAEAQNAKNAAMLGKATAAAIDGKTEVGINLVEEILAKAPKTDTDLYGQAYLTLGNCHRAAGKPKEALLDYLHVDLLYAQNPQTHAETLAALSKVWQELSRPDRARDAATRLSRMYPNSRWAKQ
ncbi:MAG: tetratricopeptide repeat protein [Planctomycetia bacterium]|nr:tetratricopeptide repeat protein [Planctomycetia bacterium]